MRLCCIEAEYEYDPFDRQSVRPMLEILEAQGVARFTLRDAIPTSNSCTSSDGGARRTYPFRGMLRARE
jgi:hypothetical protein